MYKVLYKFLKVFATETLFNSGMHCYFLFILFYFSDCIIELQNCHRSVSVSSCVLQYFSKHKDVSPTKSCGTAVVFQ